MQFSTLAQIFAFASIAAVANASPVAAENKIQKRDVGVRLCVNADFQGPCVTIIKPLNTCINLGSDLNDLVTAAGPDANAGTCRFFKDFNCNDSNGALDLRFPGTPNLALSNPGWNDVISSYICFG